MVNPGAVKKAVSVNQTISVPVVNNNLNLTYIFRGGAPVDYVRPSYFIALNGG